MNESKLNEQGDRARKALHDMRWGPHIDDVIERQEVMDDATQIALRVIGNFERALQYCYDDKEVMQNTIDVHEAKLAEYENDETPTRRELALVKRIMEQPWDDSHDKGREEAFKRLAKIRNALNLNSDPETEDAPSIDDDSRSGPHSRGTTEGNAFAAQQEPTND